jgi:hypothetical protein
MQWTPGEEKCCRHGRAHVTTSSAMLFLSSIHPELRLRLLPSRSALSAERCPHCAAFRRHCPLRPTDETMAILLIIIMQQEEERGMRTAQLEGRRPDQYVHLMTGLVKVRSIDLSLAHRPTTARTQGRTTLSSPLRVSTAHGARIADSAPCLQAVVVGDGACGKTSLLNVYISGTFPEGYEPTVFENHCVDVGKRSYIPACAAAVSVLVH